MVRYRSVSAAHRFRIDRNAGWQAGRDQQVWLAVELRHHAGGYWREVVWVEQPEQGVRQFRKFIVQPVMYASGEECHAFEQTGDMGVVHRIGRKAQPAGDLRMGVGELRGQALDRVEFTFVIGEQGIRHWA